MGSQHSKFAQVLRGSIIGTGLVGIFLVFLAAFLCDFSRFTTQTMSKTNLPFVQKVTVTRCYIKAETEDTTAIQPKKTAVKVQIVAREDGVSCEELRECSAGVKLKSSRWIGPVCMSKKSAITLKTNDESAALVCVSLSGANCIAASPTKMARIL